VHVPLEELEEITVCGDIHGQYYDLMNIFKLNGHPSESNPYIFNGDFIDRGSFSVEVILTLIMWKICLPQHLYMTRGNHEASSLNRMYGFFGEVTAKYAKE
jgi:serine/threonine-protein phosphatase 5